MSDINFRVRVYPVAEGEEVIRENFKTGAEAESFFEAIQNPGLGKGVIDSLPYNAIVLTLEEFYNGEWTVKTKRLVMK